VFEEQSTFSSRLRAATRADHTEAETSTFISDLMQGERRGWDYVLLLAQYRPIYAALESAVAAHRDDPAVAELFDAKLDRLACIDADLRKLKDWAGLDEVPEVVPATRVYAERIVEAGERGDLAALLAHHYLRYLGDLSGGQAIGKLVSRHYGTPAEAMTMWHFEGIPKPKVYKDRYRDLLDDFGTDAQRDAVVAEAIHGFQLNRGMFIELDDVSRTVVPV
jgi:heme oxygenase